MIKFGWIFITNQPILIGAFLFLLTTQNIAKRIYLLHWHVVSAQRQVPNLKRILTKAEFSQKQVGVYKYPDKRCECCASLILGNSHTFKNVDKTFNLKTYFSCDSYNLLYIIICPTCGEEYTGESGIGKTKLRDLVRVYRQHVRQPEYQKLKVEEHLRTCGKGTFKIDLRRS